LASTRTLTEGITGRFGHDTTSDSRLVRGDPEARPDAFWLSEGVCQLLQDPKMTLWTRFRVLVRVLTEPLGQDSSPLHGHEVATGLGPSASGAI
jgi:hypothetical protein